MENTKNDEINEILHEIERLKILWGEEVLENLKNENIEEVNSDNKYLDRLYPAT